MDFIKEIEEFANRFCKNWTQISSSTQDGVVGDCYVFNRDKILCIVQEPSGVIVMVRGQA